MSDLLNIWGKRRAAVILQAESSECALACAAMVAHYHGYETDLRSLRARHKISVRGANLKNLIDLLKDLGLLARPLKMDLAGLAHLTLPAILHWDLNHFVVLVECKKKRYVIHDPARGKVVLSREQISRHFTGVALEISPTPNFKPKQQKKTLSLSSLLGRPQGLVPALAKIVLITLVIQFFILINPIFFQIAIDNIVLNNEYELLHILLISFISFSLLYFISHILRGFMQLHLTSQISFHLSSHLLHHLIKLPSTFFASRHFGSIFTRFESLNPLRALLVNGFAVSVIDGLLAITTLILMMIYSIWLTAVTFAFLSLFVLIKMLTYRELRNRSEEVIVVKGKEYSRFSEIIRDMDNIKLFGAETDRFNVWQQLHASYVNAEAGVRRVGVWLEGADLGLQNLERIVLIYFGVLMIIDAQLTVGMFVAFLAYHQNFKTTSISLVEKFLEYRLLDLHLERIGDIALEPEEYLGEPDADRIPMGQPIGISIKNVSFRYADNLPWVLKEASLLVNPGDCVAIVGPSGSGKSTLLKILTGLLEPQVGEVLINGRPSKDIGIGNVRRHLGVVMQDGDMMDGSISDNISFHDPDAQKEDIEEAAKLAALHDDIVKMPMAYNSLLTSSSSTLSGGQKQRLMLARALYRKPGLLIIDEGTSNLDIHTERKVSNAIARQGMTRIIIAHRPETIGSANQIIELENGAFYPVKKEEYLASLFDAKRSELSVIAGKFEKEASLIVKSQESA